MARMGLGGRRTHRRDRVVRRFLMVVFFLGVATLAAPSIVGHTSLRDIALARVIPPAAGKLTATDASIGWFRSTVLQGVRLTDPEGRVVLHADQVSLDRSLWQLAMNAKNLGAVRVDRPALYMVVRPDGSSLEDLLTALEVADPTSDDQSSADSNSTKMTLQITGGSLAVTDSVSGVTTIHDPIDIEATLAGQVTSAKLTARVAAQALRAGATLPVLPLESSPIKEPANLTATFGPDATGASAVEFQLNQANLAAAAPFVHRLDPMMQIAGVVSGQGTASWWPREENGATLPTRITTSGAVRITNLELFAPVLGPAPLRTWQIDLPWQITTTATGILRIGQLGLASDFATATLTGELSPAEVAAVLAGDWSAPRAVQLKGEVDLARLAAVAPTALHLREEVTLTSGQVRLAAGAQSEATGRRVRATLETADLIAQAKGKPIRWEKPIQVQLAALDGPGGFELTRLACQSNFLNGSCSGDLSDLRGTIKLDLDKLVAETQQLFDYGPWRLSGRADTEIQLTRDGKDLFDAKVDGHVDGCVITHGDRPIVQERKLAIGLTAAGEADPRTHKPIGFTTARMKINAAGDQMVVRLVEPTATTTADYPLDMNLVGDLHSWLRRLKFLTLDSASEASFLGSLNAAGSIDAKVAGRFGANRVQIAKANITATELNLTTPSLAILEPKVQFTGDLAWDAASGAIASRSGELVSSTVAIRARDLMLRGGEGSGELALNANLARLANWAPDLTGDTRLAGKVTGGLQLVSQPGGPAAQLDLVVEPFLVGEANASGQTTVLWKENRMQLRGGVAHHLADDRLTLTNLAIRSDNFSATASGQVEKLSTQPATKLNAAIDYDLTQLTPLVASWLGPSVQLTGKHKAQVELTSVAAADGAAPLHWSRRWQGRATGPWTGASLYGLPIGPGALSLTFGGGLVQAEPIAVAIGQGKLTMQPAVRLDPPPAEWGLPPGQLLENVVVTPQVSDQLLKFIAPVLADATRSEGIFSLRTDGVRAPVDDLSRMETTGQLTVRALRVAPGPSVAGYVSIGRQVEALAKNRDPTALASRPAPTLLSIAERTIDFQVTGGRVYHRGLTFDVDGVPVTSAGWVGFDETLDITLSIPIQDRWIENERRLVGLRGQVIQIPVRGALSSARPDSRALQQLNQQLIQQGVQGAIRSEIGRALDKLFD